MHISILNLVNRVFGPGRVAALAVSHVLLVAQGCGGDTANGSVGVVSPLLAETVDASKPPTRGSGPAKVRLARNRPAQFLDARIGK